MARREDAGPCLAIYAPVVEEGAVSFEFSPPAPEEMESRIAGVLEFAPWLVFEEGGEVAAYAYGTRFRERAAYGWTVETAVYVAARARGRGVGRRLYGVLLEALRLQGFRSAVAVITLPNPPSLRLHAALGFERAGLLEAVGFKHGRWHDVEVVTLRLIPGSSAPAPIVPMRELVACADFHALLGAG